MKLSLLLERSLCAGLGVFIIAAAADSARADDKPCCPGPACPSAITSLVVPYPPGGPSDRFARLLADGLKSATGGSFVVENRPGAGGEIALDSAARSDPTKTLLVATSQQALNNSLAGKPGRDLLNDFDPTAMIAATPYVLAASSKSDFKDLQGLVSAARASPGKLTYGSVGNTTPGRLLGEQLKSAASIDLLHVPYKSMAQLVEGLESGDIKAAFLDLPIATEALKRGRLRALAITSDKRNGLLKEVPTFGESGVPAFTSSNWIGVFEIGKGKAKPECRKAVRISIEKTLQQPDIKRTIEAQGYSTPDFSEGQFQQFLRNDAQTWAKIARQANIKAE